MSPVKDYDSTIARMAGNIAAGLVSRPDLHCTPYSSPEEVAQWVRGVSRLSVGVAVQIVRLCKEAQANGDATL